MEELIKFIREEEGATAVEYGIMVALIAVVIIVAVQLVGQRLLGVFNRVATALGIDRPTNKRLLLIVISGRGNSPRIVSGQCVGVHCIWAFGVVSYLIIFEGYWCKCRPAITAGN